MIQFLLLLPLIYFPEDKPQTMLWFFLEVILVVNYYSYTHTFFFSERERGIGEGKN